MTLNLIHQIPTTMMFSWIAIIVAALVPTAVGFVWYHPKVLGTAWMQASGMTEEKIQGGNMGVIFGVSLVMSILLALFMSTVVIHQSHVNSLFMNTPEAMDPSTEIGAYYADFMAKYGGNFRSFKHGLFHGILAGVLFALPIMSTNALFERKGFKYIAVNAGYWIVTLGLMGGIICAWQ